MVLREGAACIAYRNLQACWSSRPGKRSNGISSIWLMRFSPDNIQMICDSAHYIRAWKDANGDDYPLEQ